jgi:hypothetical protein
MQGSHIFAQILQRVDWVEFDRLVKHYGGDKAAKGLTCRDIFTTMLFAQFLGADSLREITQGLSLHGGALSHIGLSKAPLLSSLSYANAHRSWLIFRDMFELMAVRAKARIKGNGKPHALRNKKLFSTDSTVIDLTLEIYPWAKFRRTKGAVKIHTVLDHDGFLPVFANITDGKVHDVKAFKENVLTAFDFPKDSILAMDRAYVDFALFRTLTQKGVWFVTRIKDNTVHETVEKREPPARSNVTADHISPH